MDDFELLKQYVCQGSRPALDELVHRHVGMVYAAALREVRDPHLAEDIAQSAFLVLMRRAPSLAGKRRVPLAGWLFQVVHFTAADARKASARRHHHERQAADMRSGTTSAPGNAEIDRLIPLLNAAIASLGARDRDVVVMSYLQGRSHREVAEAQCVSENAVRQRLFRAMRNLRSALRRRGINASPMSISAALAAAAAQTHPPGLVAAIGGAMSVAGPAGHSALLANATIRSISMLKLKMFASGIAAVVALSAGAGYVATVLAADAPPPAAAPAPTTAPASATTQPTTAPGPADQPKETMENAFAAAEAGNAEALTSCFDHLTDEQTKTFTTVARVMLVASNLRKAVADRFGPAGGDEIIVLFGGQALRAHALDNVPANITGDSATVGEGDGAYHLVKVGSVWKIVPDADAIARARTVFDNINSQLDTLKSLTADVKAGKYSSADAVRDALGDILKPNPEPPPGQGL